MGYWAGLVMAVVFYPESRLIDIACMAFAGAIWSWFAYSKITGES